MTDNININEIGEDQFEEKVLKESTSALILVDFWAPWCEPCKQLTPVLEKIVRSAKGRVKLVKINIDENKQIAGQLRVQSIPAVFAFKDEQPKDAFQGVIPEKKIIEFIEKNLGEKLKEDFTGFYEIISNHFTKKEYEIAKESLEQFLAEHPEEFKSFAMYIDSLVLLNLIDDAEIFAKSLTKEAAENSFIKSSLQKLVIKKKNLGGPSIEEIKNDLKKNPKNINLIIKLADKYFSENTVDEAFNTLLPNYNISPEQIKTKCIEFFNALGNDNPKTSEYRKKLSSLIFS